jgi:hypothetical protein
MPCRSGTGNRDVVTWFVAVVLLVAAWACLVGARRRAARRVEEARARARARLRRAPHVSANVRPQADRKPDIWREDQEAAARE